MGSAALVAARLGPSPAWAQEPVAAGAGLPAGTLPILAALVAAALVATALLARSAQRSRRRLSGAESRLAELEGALARAHSVAETAPRHIVLDGDGRAAEPFLATLHPDDAAALTPAIDALVRHGETVSTTVRAADSSTVWRVDGRGAPPGRAGPPAVLWLTDIGDEAARNQALAELERRATGLATLLDLVPTPVWLRHGDLGLRWTNQAYRRAVEAPLHDETAGGQEIAAEVPDAAGRALAEAARASGRAESVSDHVVIDGQRRYLRFTEAPVADPDGQGQAIAGYALDHTQADAARSELARHIVAHDQVLHRLRTAIAIFGADKQLQFYNQAYAALWGFEERWLDEKPSFSEILEDLRERRRLPETADFRAYKDERLALFTNVIEPVEELDYLPHGNTIRTVIAPHPFGGLLWVIEDVTSALSLEASYNTLIAVQQESLDNLAEGIAVFGSDGRLRLSNPEYSRLWGMSREELADSPHITAVTQRMREHFVPGAQWDGVRNALTAEAMEQHIQRGRLNRRDGQVIDFSTVRLPDGGVLLSFLDVTDAVRVERALRASNEALEEADKLKSLFVANVSYQLRTPLQAITGFAELLEKQISGPLNTQQLDYAHSLMEAANLLVKLINDMLDLATIEAGQLTLQRRTIDVRQLIRSVADLARGWADKERVVIAVNCPETVGAVAGDERRLKQALFNLIGNAIKFTPPGGRITLAADRGDDTLNLVVHDTGIGIPPDDHERVFNRFERSHQNLRQSGAGLGLALVKKLIEMHGGHVELESEVGRGTTVICALPLDQAAAKPVGAHETETEPTPSATEDGRHDVDAA